MFWILVAVWAGLAGGIAWSVICMRREFQLLDRLGEELLAGMPAFIEKKRKERGE